MKNKPTPVQQPQPSEKTVPTSRQPRVLEYVQFRDGIYLGPVVEILTEARAPKYLIVLEADDTGPTVLVQALATQSHARVPLSNVAAYRVALA